MCFQFKNVQFLEHSKAWAQPQKRSDHTLICSDIVTHLKASDWEI